MNVKSTYICPVCGKEFENIHDFATHVEQHSKDEKKRQAEEEKKRLEAQKKYDAEKLDKLLVAYREAQSAYLDAKHKYDEKYGNFNEYDVWKEIEQFVKNNGWRLFN